MSTQQTANKPQALDTWFLELLRCPVCEAKLPLKLNADQTALNCESGRHAFPIRDGIPILLAEEAISLDATAETASL